MKLRANGSPMRIPQSVSKLMRGRKETKATPSAVTGEFVRALTRKYTPSENKSRRKEERTTASHSGLATYLKRHARILV
jgi:hypothetical protein